MENLEVLLSSNGIGDRIKNSGLSRHEYKSGLEEYMKDNLEENEKITSEFLTRYDKHVKWKKAEDKVIGGLNKVIWTINGTAPIALISMFGVSYLASKFQAVQNLNLTMGQGIGGIVSISLLEFLAIKNGFKCLAKRWEEKEKDETGEKIMGNYNSCYMEILGRNSANNYGSAEREEQ